MNIWQFIFSIIRKNKLLFLASCLCSAAPRSISAYASIYYADIIAFIGTNPKEALSSPVMHMFMILAACYFAEDFSRGLRTYIDARLKIRYQRTIHNEVFRHNHKHSATFFNTEQSGNIIAKSDNLISGTFQMFGRLRAFFIPNFYYFITAAIILSCINIYLSLSLVTLNLIVMLITYFNIKPLQHYKETAAKEESKTTGILVDSIANARLVKNSGIFAHEKRALRQQMNQHFRKEIIAEKKGGIKNGIATMILTIAAIASYLIIIAFYYYDTLTLADIILSATMSRRLNEIMFDTGEVFYIFQENLGRINDALKLLYRPFDITDAPNAKRLKIKDNTIEIKNLNFAYKKGKNVLENINLSVDKNEKIGLVGRSGSGKSTLINLLLRGLEPDKGKISISGVDISKVTQFSLHQNIALISQEPCLFNRSIKENIRFAKPKATDKEIINAAKLAHIHDTIMKMPQGYDSVVGDRGVKLSGGERQRIAIAAAILKDAPILILDEATSALDSESETAIEKALKNIIKNKTVIAIAHRLSTLKNMDKIIVLDKGEIIEKGSEKDLLKNKNGIFSRLYRLQSDGYLSQ